MGSIIISPYLFSSGELPCSKWLKIPRKPLCLGRLALENNEWRKPLPYGSDALDNAGLRAVSRLLALNFHDLLVT
jgi:hypothetical protein